MVYTGCLDAFIAWGEERRSAGGVLRGTHIRSDMDEEEMQRESWETHLGCRVGRGCALRSHQLAKLKSAPPTRVRHERKMMNAGMLLHTSSRILYLAPPSSALSVTRRSALDVTDRSASDVSAVEDGVSDDCDVVDMRGVLQGQRRNNELMLMLIKHTLSHGPRHSASNTWTLPLGHNPLHASQIDPILYVCSPNAHSAAVAQSSQLAGKHAATARHAAYQISHLSHDHWLMQPLLPYFDIHDPKHAQTVNLCLLPTWSRQHAPLSPVKHKKDMQHHPALALVVALSSSFECLSFVRVPPSLPLHKVVDYNCATS